MLEFTKWEGLGNDFIVTELDWRLLRDPSNLAARICDRNFGVGADGLVFLTRSPEPDACLGMKIWNSDGSLAKMCGNALRCLGSRAHQLGWLKAGQWEDFSTDSGPRSLRLVPSPKQDAAPEAELWIEVDMGIPVLAAQPTNFDYAGQVLRLNPVSMGNPHLVIDGTTLERKLWHDCSALLQTSSMASEGGVNVEWWSLNADQSLEVWVYERGVGPTLACGTGACAVFVHLSQSLELTGWVHLPGGWLKMRSDDDRVFMNGPARRVFSGQLDWSVEFL